MRKPLPGWEGFYEITDLGEVYSLDRTVTKTDGTLRKVKGQLLKHSTNTKGYLVVRLSKPGVRLSARVHRLVAMTFIPNPDELPEVNHKDGNRCNPALSNLEWCTSSGNSLHAYYVLGSVKMPRICKLTEEQVVKIRSEHVPGVYGCRRLAKKYGVTPTAIRDLINRRSHSLPPAPSTEGESNG